MSIALFSFKVDPDGRVRIAHVFFGPTKSAVEAELLQHAEVCPKFGPAYKANQTIEYAREIVDLPPSDGDELEEWLDELLGESEEEAEDDVIDVSAEEE